VPSHVGLLPDCALSHALTARDQVDQHPEEGHQEEDDDPAGLGPSRQLVVAEQIADDRDQDPEVEDEQKDLDDGEQRVSENSAIGIRSSLWILVGCLT